MLGNQAAPKSKNAFRIILFWGFGEPNGKLQLKIGNLDRLFWFFHQSPPQRVPITFVTNISDIRVMTKTRKT